MFKDFLGLKERMQEAMHNPALALRNGLAQLADKIRSTEEELDKQRGRMTKLAQETEERNRERRRGIFGRKKEPGLFGAFEEGLDNWALKGTKSSIADLEAERERLRDLYAQLQERRYPTNKQWSFDEIDREITRLYNQLAGAHASMEQTAAMTMSMTIATQPTEEQPAQNDPWAGLVKGFQQLSSAAGAMEGMDEVLLQACKLTLELDELYAVRRLLQPSYLSEVAAWDKARITAELQRRNRDLAELPSEGEALKRQIANLPAHMMISPEMVKRSPLYAVFGEQRRFLQDLIFDLEAALKRAQTVVKPPDPTEDILNQIKELKRKRDAAMANETDAEIQDAIRRAYGKKIDTLSEQL